MLAMGVVLDGFTAEVHPTRQADFERASSEVHDHFATPQTSADAILGVWNATLEVQSSATLLALSLKLDDMAGKIHGEA
jgi:hypothetical protein